MLSLPQARFEETLLVDYRSTVSTQVTHVRAGVLVTSLQSLKHAGHFERYLAELDVAYHEQVQFALAATWLPLEVCMAHLRALDGLALPESFVSHSGESVGRDFGKMIYTAVMKTTRSVGANAGWFLLRQCERLMQRVYMGGGCTLLQTGPKDAVLELHGLPMVSSRFFRLSHHAYMNELGRMMGTGAYVRATRPRGRHLGSIATSFSWV